MSWAALFGLTNLVAVVGWLMLLALPRRPLTYSAILFGCVGLLCLAYTAIFIALFFVGADAGRVAGAPAPDLTDYSIGGIRGLFMSDGGIVVGWTHYLAFDLFTGLWISRDADAKGFSRLAQLPSLLLTFLAGPIGLLSWLLLREGRTRKVAREGA